MDGPLLGVPARRKERAIYGCEGEDSLLHYIAFPIFWKALRKIAKVAGDTGANDLMINLAPEEEVKSGILNVAVALDVYNNLKSRGKLAKEDVHHQMSESYKRLVAL